MADTRESDPKERVITPEMQQALAALRKLSADQRAWVIREAERPEATTEQAPDAHAQLRVYLEQIGAPISPEDILIRVCYQRSRVPTAEGRMQLQSDLEEKLLAGERPEDLRFDEKGIALREYRLLVNKIREELGVFFKPEENLAPCPEPVMQVWREKFLPILAEHLIRSIFGGTLPELAGHQHSKDITELIENYLLSEFQDNLGYKSVADGLAPDELRRKVWDSMPGYTHNNVNKQIKIAKLALDYWHNPKELLLYAAREGFSEKSLDDATWIIQIIRELGNNDAVRSMCPDLNVAELDQMMAKQGLIVDQGIYRRGHTAGKPREQDPAALQLFAGKIMQELAQPMVLAMAQAEPAQDKYKQQLEVQKKKKALEDLDRIGVVYERKFKEQAELISALEEINRLLAKTRLGFNVCRGEERARKEAEVGELELNIKLRQNDLDQLVQQARPYQSLLGELDVFAEVAKQWDKHQAYSHDKGRKINI